MPITTQEIQEHNGSKTFSTSEICLVVFILNWIQANRVIFPVWQREDCWPDYYRVKLIESILTKCDIPKFYLSKISDQAKYYLLDGGHRTRAIMGYIKNEYPIQIDKINVYYNYVSSGTERNNRIMDTYEKDIFDNYKLTLTKYENLTEKDSRVKFNNLQNAQPMTMADIVNSHESPLIDYLRSLRDYLIDGQKLSDIANSKEFRNCCMPKAENSELLYHLGSLWTICFPLDITNKVTSSLKYALKGEKRDTSMCFRYILEYNESISDEQKVFFQAQLQIYIDKIRLIEAMGIKLKQGECLSIYHSTLYVKRFSLDKYFEYIMSARKKEQLHSTAKSFLATDNTADYLKTENEARNLDTEYGYKLTEWNKGYSNINQDNMTKRYTIITKYCIEEEVEETEETVTLESDTTALTSE